LMMVVPERPDVRLYYAARTWTDWLGYAATLAALILALAWRSLPKHAEPPQAVSVEQLECDFGSAPRRWGGWIPAALILGLVISRFIVT